MIIYFKRLTIKNICGQIEVMVTHLLPIMPFVFSLKVSLVTIIKFANEKKKKKNCSHRLNVYVVNVGPGHDRPSKRASESLSYSQELRQTHECDTWSMRV